MAHWSLDDIAWNKFDRSKVDPTILRVIKAASLVEGNGQDYADYLCNVFHDDPEFQALAQRWAVEEVQHGLALGRWANLADPTFDFETRRARFTEGFRVPIDQQESIRGSRAAELVARCIVEVGTSSHYTALMEAVEEPVLKDICRRIAADELRHYKMFYDHLKRYIDAEGISRLKRVWIAVSRIGESEDDELPYAYYAANDHQEPYDRKRVGALYGSQAFQYYRPHHIARVVAMTMKAVGLNPQGRASMMLTGVLSRYLKFRQSVMRRRAANALSRAA